MTDFDLHGLAGIRLIDATADDVAMVRRQLGPIEATLDREPDIDVRFVDTLSRSVQLRYLGLDDVAFTDDAFLVLRGRHKSRARVQISFERIGERCEIVCERGLLQVPLLIPIVNMTVLARGALPLHAAAFTYERTGVLAAGWAKGGKTETLLGFMSNGATYIGDEWVYLTGDGRRMYGIPEPVRLWKWHLDCLPLYRHAVRRGGRAKLRALEMAVGGIERLTSRGSFRSLRRIKPHLAKQLCVDVSPAELFGPAACSMSGQPDVVLFVVSHDSPEITVQPLEGREIARRMVFSLDYERMNFLSYYQKFRFAFPDAANEAIENSHQRQREILEGIMDGKEAYEVRHPYPVDISALYEAIVEGCLKGGVRWLR